MEELLNKLVEKGWKPFGENRIDEINRAEQYAGNWNWCCWGNKDAIQRRKSTRQIVSKESGLWQFVCENGMVDKESHERVYDISFGPYGPDCKAQIVSREYQYRLIESALKDESELEEFLLNNIKVDE